MRNINLSGVDKATWARSITLVLALANQVATNHFNFKLLPFTDAEINEGVAVGITILSAILAGWKNNSFTEEAQEADKILKK